VVFLHACACGRSRRLRKDPFDYESANVSFFQFPNCEDLLPSLAMPSGDGGNSLGGSAWSLVHLGNAQYYQPMVGLTQIGFCTKQNFLSPCKFVVVYHKESTPNSLQTKEDAGPGTEDVATDTDLLASKRKVLLPRPQTAALESKAAVYPQQSLYSKVAEKGAITEMRGLSKAPSVVSDRWAISTTFFKASYGGDAAFPPLPQKNERLLAVTPAKSAKQTSGKERKTLSVSQPMQGEHHLPAKPDTLNVTSEKHPENVNIMQNGRENADKESTDSDAVAVGGIGSTKTEEFCAYVGFEHECPHGHRFLLSVDHLQSLGPSYTQLPSNVQHSVRESSDVLPKQTKQGRRACPSKEHSTASGGQDASAGFYGESLDTSTPVEQKAAEGLTFMSVSEGSSDGHTLLGLNLPIYMNCPYCRDSDSKQDGVVFAGCVSQLQRIFLVCKT
jgi:protein SMG8